VQFYAFDVVVSDGQDVRWLPLSMRKANLARLLARRVDGIFFPTSNGARSGIYSGTPA
jgi:bifunctional non-homologous end joining protein LigD